MDEVMFVIAGAIAVLDRDFECHTKSRSGLINCADIKSVNMRVRVKAWISRVGQFGIAVKLTKRMKPSIGKRREPLLGLKVRRFARTREPGVDDTQTGCQ